MKDVMVDLETMGSGHRAAVVSIGAVRFDPVRNQVGSRVLGETFYERVGLVNAQKCGCTIDASTVLWWLQQPDAARREILDGTRLRLALEKFAAFLGRDARVWGNGMNFDNRILRELYEMLDMPCPWHYRDDRDMRTACALAKSIGVVVAPRFEGVEHHALDDAIYQATVVCAIYDKIGRRK